MTEYRYVQEMTPISEEELTKLSEAIKELARVPNRRLLYGEWLPDECENCHTKENVSRYKDTSGKEKKPIYLCSLCFVTVAPLLIHEWTAEDNK